MRKIIYFLLVMLFFILIVQENLSIFALLQDEASINLSWSKLSYYPGDEGALSIAFESKCPDELKISLIEIKFNWTTTQETIPIDFSEDPVGIPSNDEYTFNPIIFQIPENATEGSQKVVIRFQGMQHGLLWYDFEWTSPPETIEVKINYQQLYNQLNLQISTNLDEALNANYQNEDALNLLDNAKLENNIAISLANQNRWEEAVSRLYQSQEYLDQAKEKEQQLSMNELTSTVATIAILIIIGLIVSIIFGRKTRS